MKLGTRGSPLALTQCRLVADLLARASGQNVEDFPLESFITSGDRLKDQKLQDAGGKGLFTKELDEALLDRRIDAGVHSMKDLPTRLPDGIMLAAVPEREDPRDAFISHKAKSLGALPQGAVVGTASLRRQAQALHLRPDLKVITLRGSVQTRLKKLEEGVIDATFLALAGLKRLSLTAHVTSMIDDRDMPPAPGQGALAITCRADDTKTRALLAKISSPMSEIAVAAERGFLEALDGSCRTPIGALATITGGRLAFLGEILSPDGARRWRREESMALGNQAGAAALGRTLGAAIRAEAGEAFIQSLEKRGW
ncbi:MAG TPA: hydroxymethylbilane synthase [Rhizomicrobium sp.]|jgi:hydroxymethylbilane synthase|nr:hydroxymethylbilane synthase [Rhizomicrobium sp.]